MRIQRPILVAGNWKEHFYCVASFTLASSSAGTCAHTSFCRSSTFSKHFGASALSVQIDRRKFRLGAQDGYFQDAGAYTGEVSMAML